MFGQQLQDARRGFGMGPVIKGEVDGLFLPGAGKADPGENAVGDICYLAVKHLYSPLIQKPDITVQIVGHLLFK